MPDLRVRTVEFLDPLERADPAAGEARVRVAVEGGRDASFVAATFDRPRAWMKARKQDHFFGEPVLYVRRLEPALVRSAAEAMAARLGGYWLRYYRAAPGAPSKIGVGTAALDRVEDGAGVVEVVLKDGREFSMLAATPERWTRELDARRLDLYFGPLVLFLERLDPAVARRAAKRMAETDEQLFPRYDTPRKTLTGVLDEFASPAK